MSNTRPYRTLVFAELVQESALNVGGNQPHRLVDSPLALDGQQRPVLRGSSLAGCFIHTARHINAGHLPRAITSDDSDDVRTGDEPVTLVASSWRFAHGHLVEQAHTPIFLQHVSIDAQTQAAKDDALFSIEALPPGTRWHFELEITPPTNATPDTDFAELERLALAVLQEWQQHGGIRLGRGGRHGYGWCHLEHIAVVRLHAPQHLTQWPNAWEAHQGRQWLTYFENKHIPSLSLQAFAQQQAPQSRTIPTPTARHVLELLGRVKVGERQDQFGNTYGLDTLSIGGHARAQLQANELREHVIGEGAENEADFDPDFVITTMLHTDRNNWQAYIPGASIRGVWRHHLQRHVNATRQHQPQQPFVDQEQIDTLFGTTEQAGCLSVADAYLVQDCTPKLFWQQHVAIDELSGGAYESAKFDRLCIASAEFEWRARIEADSEEHVKQLGRVLRKMLRELGKGQLPIGGGVWRGHGHVNWSLQLPCTLRLLGAIHSQENA